jgi:hypothetical protein
VLLCLTFSLMPALLPMGDEFPMKFEAVSVFFSMFLLLLETFPRIGSNHRRGRGCSGSGDLRSRIGVVLWAWPTGSHKTCLRYHRFLMSKAG